MTPGHRIPKGLLLEGKAAIRDAFESFSKAKKWDVENERRPK
jgi:serine/threonine-protein phosphatase 2B catalytic subunit